MLRHRLLVVVVVVCAYAVAGGAWAQFIPEIGLSAEQLARGGTGVATPAGHATGVLNPATLGLLYRMPAARDEVVASVGATTPLAAWAGDDRWRGLLAFTDGSEFGALSARPTQFGDSLAAVTVPPEWLDPNGRAGVQITIESRFVTLEQDFIRDLGVNWNLAGLGAGMIGYEQDLEDSDRHQSVQAVWGRIGEGMPLGVGWITEHGGEFVYAAIAKTAEIEVLQSPGTLSFGAKVNYSDFGGGEGSDFTYDAGTVLEIRPEVSADRRYVTLALGAVVHDIFDEYGDWGQGTRLDVGAAASGEKWLFEFDLADLTDRAETRVGAHVLVDPHVTVMAGLLDDEFTYGARAKLPILGDIPVINFLFSHTEREDRVGLMILVTPNIMDTSEE